MRRLGLMLLCVVLIVSCLSIGYRFSQGNILQTDFLTLLPDEEQNPAIRLANEHMKDQVTQRVLLLLRSKDFETTKKSAQYAVDQLSEFVSLNYTQKNVDYWTQKLFPYRANLLSEQDREWLEKGQADKISQRALAQIMSPLFGMPARLITDDPYLLFPTFLSSLGQNTQSVEFKDGWMVAKDYIVLVFKLKQGAFDNSYQKSFISAFDGLVFSEETQVLKTGALFYAQRGAEQAESEATWIGSISLVGILLLNIIVFRSLRSIGLSLLTISVGILGGAGVSLLLFPQLHLMALVFGAGLIGISVDYTFHYCCEGGGRDDMDADARIKHIARPLSFGVTSSIIGFLMLALAPFPGLQQIAVFAASGLFMAYLSVMCLYPLIDKNKGPIALQVNYRPKRRLSLVVGGVCFIAALYGTSTFYADDNVRSLQKLPVDLKQQEERIREISTMDNSIHFILLEGSSIEEILQREELLGDKLRKLRSNGYISGFQAVSQLIPSQKKQMENQALVRQHLLERQLSGHQAAIGLKENLNTYRFDGTVSLNDELADLRLSERNHLVRVYGVHQPETLEKIASQVEGALVLDQAKDISLTLGKYREWALLLTGIACLVVFAFLCSRYSLQNALRIVIVPVAAVTFTPLIAAAFGDSFTFFNAIALLMVFTIGLDYALFFHEALGCDQPYVALANALSALSTILSFGLLTFSDLYAIHAFGVTVLIGISIAFMLAPISANERKEQE